MIFHVASPEDIVCHVRTNLHFGKTSFQESIVDSTEAIGWLGKMMLDLWWWWNHETAILYSLLDFLCKFALIYCHHYKDWEQKKLKLCLVLT